MSCCSLAWSLCYSFFLLKKRVKTYKQATGERDCNEGPAKHVSPQFGQMSNKWWVHAKADSFCVLIQKKKVLGFWFRVKGNNSSYLGEASFVIASGMALQQSWEVLCTVALLQICVGPVKPLPIFICYSKIHLSIIRDTHPHEGRGCHSRRFLEFCTWSSSSSSYSSSSSPAFEKTTMLTTRFIVI